MDEIGELMADGKLLLIPSVLHEGATHTIPDYVIAALDGIDLFLVEHDRTARRFLRKAGYSGDFDAVELRILDKDTSREELLAMVDALVAGRDAALISEAGLPCVADPGAKLVHLAQEQGIRVIPFVGPSSLMMALMASGLNGQAFRFSGYLPIDKKERKKAILQLEQEALAQGCTQIFIETPYRNDKLISDLIATCRDETLLCMAVGITGPDEWIHTKPIGVWKKQMPQPGKIPAVFLLGASNFGA